MQSVVDAKPKSPDEMIQQIREIGEREGWVDGDLTLIREARAGLTWISSKKSFLTGVYGNDDHGLVQFWHGSLPELTKGGRALDRLRGSATRISVEEATQHFMGSLSAIRG